MQPATSLIDKQNKRSKKSSVLMNQFNMLSDDDNIFETREWTEVKSKNQLRRMNSKSIPGISPVTKITSNIVTVEAWLIKILFYR